MKNYFLFAVLPLWIIYLCSRLMPRNRDLIVFGTHTSSFSGNIKSLFLNRSTSLYRKVFISDNNKLIEQLSAQGYEIYYKFSLKGIWYSLRVGTYVYSGFPSDINFWLSGGAKYVNVWHGTPIKKIERDVTTGKYSLRNKYEWIFKILKPHLLAKPDVLLASSAFEEKQFCSAFGVTEDIIVRAFPPRLESLRGENTSNTKLLTVLYAPTWRDDHSFSFTDYVDLDSFNTFLQKNSMIFKIKLHPSDKSTKIQDVYSNISMINQTEDVYDYLKEMHVLVSDYSSMVFESLYLSKPVVLFCPDYDSYQKNSREFYINPCTELPVEVSYGQKELEKKLLLALESGTSVVSKNSELYKPYAIEENLLEKLVKHNN